MKKEIFKVCTLGLVAVTLVTGCGKESETTKKVAKSNEQEIVLDEESNKLESNSSIDSDSNIESNSNEEITSNKTSNVKTSKVVKVELKETNIGNNKIKVYINATDAKGKTVWTKDAFTYTAKGGTDFNDLIAIQGDTYYYYGDSLGFKALDIQTGKTVWTSGKSELGGAAILKEYNNKLYVESGMGSGYCIDVYDLSTGKHLKKVELDKSLEKKDSRLDFETYYDLATSTMKIENNKITFEVHDSDDYGHDTGYIGTLSIDLSNYEITFE